MGGPSIRILFAETTEGHGEAAELFLKSLSHASFEFQTATSGDEIRAMGGESWDAAVLDLESEGGRKEDFREKIKLFLGNIPLIDLAEGPAEIVTSSAVSALESYFADSTVNTLAAIRTLNHVLEHRRLYEENEKLKTTLEKVDRHEPMTKLWTHAYITERMQELFQDYKRYKYPMTLCLFDILDMESISDNYGYEVVDSVIRKFGEIVRQAKRSNDYAGRLDDDLFCIAFPSTPLQSALIGVERIRDALQRAVFSGKSMDNFTVGATFGVVQLGERHADLDELIAEAAELLEKAKSGGFNTIEVAERED